MQYCLYDIVYTAAVTTTINGFTVTTASKACSKK